MLNRRKLIRNYKKSHKEVLLEMETVRNSWALQMESAMPATNKIWIYHTLCKIILRNSEKLKKIQTPNKINYKLQQINSGTKIFHPLHLLFIFTLFLIINFTRIYACTGQIPHWLRIYNNSTIATPSALKLQKQPSTKVCIHFSNLEIHNFSR